MLDAELIKWRATLSSALILIGMVSTGSTQHVSKLDETLKGDIHVVSPRVLEKCEFGTSLDQLARKAHILVGFEQTSDCWLSGRRLDAVPDSEALTGLTMRQALDALVAAMPGYSWRSMSDVIVVRPRIAWDDPNDVLNVPTMPFEITNEPLANVLHRMLTGATPSLLHEHPEDHGHTDEPQRGVDGRVSMAFPGGSVLESLNEMVRAHGNSQWQVGYANGRAMIAVCALDYPSGVVMESLARFPRR